MIGNALIDVTVGLILRDIQFSTQGDFTYILIELMEALVRIVIGLVGTDCEPIPFTRKNAAPARMLETFADSTDASKQINEVEIIYLVERRNFRKQ